jgi:hypothetical protein
MSEDFINDYVQDINEYYTSTDDHTTVTTPVVWRKGYVTSTNYKYEELIYMVVDLCKVLRSAIKTKEVSDIVDKILDLDDRLPEIEIDDDDDDYKID